MLIDKLADVEENQRALASRISEAREAGDISIERVVEPRSGATTRIN